MRKAALYLSAFIIFISACSKKSHPSTSAKIIYEGSNTVNSSDKPVPRTEVTTLPPNKPLTAEKEKKLFPETIYVNDAAAKKSVDGRLYYDVEGHRYWKNYKDGKYYLFNKSMYNNPDFKPPVKKKG